MSDPQLPPIPPTAPTAQPAQAPQPPAPQQSFPASALPAQPQYPGAATAQPPYGQQAPPQPYAQQVPQQPYGQHVPQQPHGHQQAAQPGYGAPQYSVTPPAYGSASPARSDADNGLARVAFIIAMVVVGIGAIQSLAQPFIFFSSGYGASGGFFTFVFTVLLLLGSAAALVLGLIASRRPGRKLLSGIAIGAGGAQVIGIIFGWLSSLFYAFF